MLEAAKARRPGETTLLVWRRRRAAHVFTSKRHAGQKPGPFALRCWLSLLLISAHLLLHLRRFCEEELTH